MATIACDRGVIFTVGGVCAGERFQCVIPLVADAPLDVLQTWQDFEWQFENTFAALWQALMAVDCYLAGWNLQPMVAGKCIPRRKNYAVITYPGLVAGQSCPQASSFLSIFESSEQALAEPRAISAKSFWCPVPEASQNAGVVNAGVLPDLNALGAAFVNQWPGNVTGISYGRALQKKHVAGQQIYRCDFGVSRTTTFTQRRRMKPII